MSVSTNISSYIYSLTAVLTIYQEEGDAIRTPFFVYIGIIRNDDLRISDLYNNEIRGLFKPLKYFIDRVGEKITQMVEKIDQLFQTIK